MESGRAPMSKVVRKSKRVRAAERRRRARSKSVRSSRASRKHRPLRHTRTDTPRVAHHHPEHWPREEKVDKPHCQATFLRTTTRKSQSNVTKQEPHQCRHPHTHTHTAHSHLLLFWCRCRARARAQSGTVWPMEKSTNVYSCVQLGLRFSTNAPMPSFWSLVANVDSNSLRSTRMPSLSVVCIAGRATMRQTRCRHTLAISPRTRS